MAKKGSKKKVEKQAGKQLMPMQQWESQYFNELVQASNTYAKLLKQEKTYEMIVKELEESRRKIQKGEIKLPVTITLIPKVMSYQEDDKKKVLGMLDDHIGNYKTALKGIRGQVEHRYDEFIESGIRNKEFLARRFKDKHAKAIAPESHQIQDEKTLFEADFDELMKSKEKQEEFKKAKAEAIKRNARKRKGQ